jgi:membrane protein
VKAVTLSQVRRTFAQLRAIILEGTAPAATVLTGRGRAVVYVGRLLVRILKQWARDHCPQQAAALTFQTTLSLVPVLAVATTMLRMAGALDGESRLVEFLATQVLPDLRDLAMHVRNFSEKMSTGAAGPIGLFFTFVACYTLYAGVEKVFNDIWRVRVRRALMRKFLTFYALVTILPVLASVYLYWSGTLVGSGFAARFLGPLTIQWVALFLTNKLLPHTAVRWQSALAGTLVTGVLLELLKWGFVTFAMGILLTSYSGTYGTLALVPLLLVWIYVSWLVVLLGAEIAHASQNLKQLEMEDRRQQRDEPMNALVAAQLLAAVAADYKAGGKGLTTDLLAHEFGLSPEVVDRITDRLKDRGLVAEVMGDKQGFIPGRAADTITMTDVLAAFRATDLETAEGLTSPALARLVQDLDQTREARIAGVTIADLMPDPAAPRSAAPALADAPAGAAPPEPPEPVLPPPRRAGRGSA